MTDTTQKKLWPLIALSAVGIFLLSGLPLYRVLAETTSQEDSAATEQRAESDADDGGQSEGDTPTADTAETAQDEPAEASEPVDDEDNNMLPDQGDIVQLYDLFGQLFNTELVSDNGLVDYGTLRRKRNHLISTARQLEDLHPAVLMSLSQEERIAFWINTYNACTLKLVVDNYPIQPKWYMIFYPNNSIMHITGAWDRVFFRILGLEYNLREIRNDLLLHRYKDPRIVFALTEGARGGAFLRNEPIVPERLDEQLDEQVRRYLDAHVGLRLDMQANTLYLSNIFNMNKQVFLMSEYAEILKFRARRADERAWLNFLVKYLPPDKAAYLENNDVVIRFIDFDWHLNEKIQTQP